MYELNYSEGFLTIEYFFEKELPIVKALAEVKELVEEKVEEPQEKAVFLCTTFGEDGLYSATSPVEFRKYMDKKPSTTTWLNISYDELEIADIEILSNNTSVKRMKIPAKFWNSFIDTVRVYGLVCSIDAKNLKI